MISEVKRKSTPFIVTGSSFFTVVVSSGVVTTVTVDTRSVVEVRVTMRPFSVLTPYFTVNPFTPVQDRVPTICITSI